MTVPVSGDWRARARRGALTVFGGALLALLAAPEIGAEEIRGQGNVISGNEIVVGGKTVMLFGIAAPGLKELCEINEAKLKCGIVAWAELVKLADGQPVSCDSEELPPGAPAVKPESDKPVILATCYIGETDLNEAMVRSGWARAAPRQTDRYEVDETDAKESGRGLWAGQTRSAGGR